MSGAKEVFGILCWILGSVLPIDSLPQVQVVSPATGGAIYKPDEKDASDPAQRAVQDYLAKHNASAAQVSRIDDARTARCFSQLHFFSALFRQFPLARQLPADFAASNLLAVEADGKIHKLSTPMQLQELFKIRLPAVTDDKMASDAAAAWLRLAQELVQDGFYKFEILEDSIRIKADSDGKSVQGRAVVMAGGNGDIRVTLVFDPNGRLTRVTEKVDVRPGPRPICQATKLLDPDPIVRRMAEQDLLIMGRAAKEYLAQQREKADTNLQGAIDRIWARILAQE